MAGFAFPRTERLSGERRIGRLFAEGAGGFVFPLRYVVLAEPSPLPGVKVLVSVPKKNHKSAVRRNLLKRRMREAYRLGSLPLRKLAAQKGLDISLALVFSAKETTDYHVIEKSIRKILGEISQGL